MSLKFTEPDASELRPRIVVFGVGGAGGNAVGNMIESALEGVEFVAANTDAQALTHSKAAKRIQIGAAVTEGLGAGSRPEIGRAAAEETLAEIEDCLKGAHMVFVTAGMGGGTGTGAGPVVARAARAAGILTVGVVTKPFQFEGARRMRVAEAGIEELAQEVDTLIVIPNQNLFRIANERTTFAEAFAMADQVLYQGVRGVTDLMINPGLINLDFADVRAVMSEMGKAMMGTGEAEGEKRAVEAAEAAISNPLLDDTSMAGAKGVLINITGGMDMTLFEVDEAANRIRKEVDGEANIIVGSTFDSDLEGKMRVSVVATGIAGEAAAAAPRSAARVETKAPRAAERTPAPAPGEDRPWRRGETQTPQRPASQPAPAARLDEPAASAAPRSAKALTDPPREERTTAAPTPHGRASDAQPRTGETKPSIPQRADEPPAPVSRGDALDAMAEKAARRVSRGAGAFGFFGGGRKQSAAAEKIAPESAPAPRTEPNAAPAREEDVDLFADADKDDPLEIPAFLRRQAN